MSTRIVPALALATTLAATMAACGNSADDSSAAQPSTSAASVGGCTLDDAAVTGATALTSITVDGAPVQVKVATQAPCAGVLFAVVDGAPVQVKPSEQPTGAVAVHVAGRSDDLLATSTTHPRGGDQTRIYAIKDGAFVELTRGGQPLVPFGATDTNSPNAVVDCAGDAQLRVLVARPTKPSGVVMTYDVFATTYDVSGSSATAVGPEKKVAQTIPDRQMKSKYPAMFSGKQFTSCAS